MHETTIHVRWGELDPYNHVNHATYLSYLEHARVSALDHIGWGMERLAESRIQAVVVSANIRFLAASTAGDELVVRTTIAELRGASSIWRQVVVRGDDTILEAQIRLGTTDEAGHPTRTPGEFREALSLLT